MPKYGLDLLGAPMYRKLAVNARSEAMGVFWDVFGDAEKVVRGWAQAGVENIRIQGQWAGKSHNYTDAHRKRALKIAKKVGALAREFPNTKFFYSPFCEHKKGAAYMRELLIDCRAAAGVDTLNTNMVNSPILGGSWVDGWVNEIHPASKPGGMPKGSYLFSCDGTSCVDTDIESLKSQYKDAYIFFMWTYQFNLRKSGKDDGSTPPRERKAKPTEKLIESVKYLCATPFGDGTLRPGDTYKTHSEQHTDTPTPKNNKPVLLTHVKAKRAILQVGGRKVVADYTAPEVDHTTKKPTGRHLYRFDQWGYEIAIKLGGFATVRVGNEVVGHVDPGFRAGTFR